MTIDYHKHNHQVVISIIAAVPDVILVLEKINTEDCWFVFVIGFRN